MDAVQALNGADRNLTKIINRIDEDAGGTNGMNRSRAEEARVFARQARRHLNRGDVDGALDLVVQAPSRAARIVLNADPRNIRRPAVRALQRLERASCLIADLRPDLEAGPWFRPLTQFLKLGDDHATASPAFPGGPGYATTLHYFGLPAAQRAEMRRRLKDRGMTHVLGFARSGVNLRRVFGIGRVFDFLDRPRDLVPILEETWNDGIHPIVCPLENDDHQHNRQHWESRLWPKLRAALAIWHEETELVDGVLLGLELDKSWGPWIEGPGTRPDFGVLMIDDAIGRPGDDPARHIKGAFGDLGVAYHLNGAWPDGVAPDQYARVPNADAVFWQAHWPGPSEDPRTEEGFARYLANVIDAADRVARRCRVDGQRLVVSEHSQNPHFVEAQAVEVGTALAEVAVRHGHDWTGMCGVEPRRAA